MKSHTILYVNPVQRVSAQGRDKQTYTYIDPRSGEVVVTQSMNKTKEFGVGSEYSFKYNPDTNRLQTGLDALIPNPFKDLSVSNIMETYSLTQSWATFLEVIRNQNEISLQTYYEILDSVQPNYYTSEVAGGQTIFNWSKSMKMVEPNFLQKFKIILYDRPNRFTDETPRGRLSIQLIKNHDRIAYNNRAVNSALHDFYISEEHEAEQEKAKKDNIVNEAIYQMMKLRMEGSDFLNYQVGTVLTDHQNKPVVQGEVTRDNLNNHLSEYLKDSKHQMEHISRFKKMVELISTKEGRQRLDVMYLVQQAINSNIMVIRDGYYIWHSKQAVPNMYKHSNYDKLINLLLNDYINFSDTEKDVTNWYKDLYAEVKLKGVRLE